MSNTSTIEVDADTLSGLERIAAEDDMDVPELLRHIVRDYTEGNAAPPASAEEQEATLRALYAHTAEARAEAWARDVLTP